MNLDTVSNPAAYCHSLQIQKTHKTINKYRSIFSASRGLLHIKWFACLLFVGNVMIAFRTMNTKAVQGNFLAIFGGGK